LMLLRPQGLFPSAQRRAELTEHEPDAPGELALEGQVAVER
jgi:hypothetical protein